MCFVCVFIPFFYFFFFFFVVDKQGISGWQLGQYWLDIKFTNKWKECKPYFISLWFCEMISRFHTGVACSEHAVKTENKYELAGHVSINGNWLHLLVIHNMQFVFTRIGLWMLCHSLKIDLEIIVCIQINVYHLNIRNSNLIWPILQWNTKWDVRQSVREWKSEWKPQWRKRASLYKDWGGENIHRLVHFYRCRSVFSFSGPQLVPESLSVL